MKRGHAACVLAVCALTAVILADASARRGTSVAELIDVARLEREAAEADAADDADDAEATTVNDEQNLIKKAEDMYADDIDEPFSVAALGIPQLARVRGGLRSVQQMRGGLRPVPRRTAGGSLSLSPSVCLSVCLSLSVLSLIHI